MANFKVGDLVVTCRGGEEANAALCKHNNECFKVRRVIGFDAYSLSIGINGVKLDPPVYCYGGLETYTHPSWLKEVTTKPLSWQRPACGPDCTANVIVLDRLDLIDE